MILSTDTVLTSHPFNLNFHVYGINAYISDIFYSIKGYGCTLSNAPGKLNTLLQSPVIIAPAIPSDLIYIITAALPDLSDTVTALIKVNVQQAIAIPAPLITLNPFSTTTICLQKRPTIAKDCKDLEVLAKVLLPCSMTLQFKNPSSYPYKNHTSKAVFVITGMDKCCGNHHSFYIMQNLGSTSKGGFICTHNIVSPEASTCDPQKPHTIFLHFSEEEGENSVVQLTTVAHIQTNSSDDKVHVLDKTAKVTLLTPSAPLVIQNQAPLNYSVIVPTFEVCAETSTTFIIDMDHHCANVRGMSDMLDAAGQLSLVDTLPVTLDFCFNFTPAG